MIQGSKEWTNDYEACLSGDDNDLKIKTRIIQQIQESQQVKVKVIQIIEGQKSREINPKPSQWSRVETLNLILKGWVFIHNSKSNWEAEIGFPEHCCLFRT